MVKVESTITWEDSAMLYALVVLSFAFAVDDPKAGKPAKKPAVTGTVEFTGKPTFPAGTVVTISVLDVSLADAPAKVLGKITIKDPRKTPIPFSVEYDGAAIKKGHMYALGVRIEANKKLLYINDTRISVITNGKVKDIKAPVKEIKR